MNGRRRAIKSLSKLYFSILILLPLAGGLFVCGAVGAEPLKVAGSVLKNEAFLPVAIPDRDRLTPVVNLDLTIDGNSIGIARAYDDPATARPFDYLELYNMDGYLLAATWFDRFGIERMAIDRGVAEDRGMFEGVFVIVLDGDSL